MLTETAAIRATIETTPITLTWKTHLQRETMARIAHSSTAIEGNPLNIGQVEALTRNEVIFANQNAQKEVQNYLTALRWIWEKQRDPMKLSRNRNNTGIAISPNAPDGVCRDRVLMTETSLLTLHSILTEGLLAKEKIGTYKTVPNKVIDPKGNLVYLPPPPEKARPLVLEFLDWLNHTGTLSLDPIIVSAIAHHRLVSIHPFSDGNGRLARLLGLWVLRIRGVDTQHICALDDYFEKDRDLYYLKLQQARDLDDDLTYWLDYVAVGIRDTFQAVAKRISLANVTHDNAYALTRKQEEFIGFLRDHGKVSSAQLETAFTITRSRVNQIIKPLVDQGILQREGQTRSTRYFLPKQA